MLLSFLFRKSQNYGRRVAWNLSIASFLHLMRLNQQSNHHLPANVTKAGRPQSLTKEDGLTCLRVLLPHQENRITCGTMLLIQTTPSHTPTNNGGDVIHLVATQLTQSLVVPQFDHNFIMGPQTMF